MTDPTKPWYRALLDFVFQYVPSSITQAQAVSIVGSIIKGVGWAMASVGWSISPTAQDALAGPNAVTFYAGIVIAVVPMIYDWYKHSFSGTLTAASKVPGVIEIETSPHAPPEVKAVAADETVPKVVQGPMPTPMPGGPVPMPGPPI